MFDSARALVHWVREGERVRAHVALNVDNNGGICQEVFKLKLIQLNLIEIVVVFEFLRISKKLKNCHPFGKFYARRWKYLCAQSEYER